MMKKIRGFVYNTATSKLCGNYPYPNQALALYCTRSGNYFHADERMQVIRPISWQDAERIIKAYKFKHPYN